MLRAGFAVVERRAEHAAKYFYSHLFWHNRACGRCSRPGLRPWKRQRDRLFAAVTEVMDRLGDPSLPAYLRALGRDHRKFLAAPEHYAAVGASLLAAFARAAGGAWTAEVEKAWCQAYSVMAETMLEGAAGAPPGEPAWWGADVVRHARYGPDLAVLTLRPSPQLPYTAGQYVSVAHPRAAGVWRTYSIGNAPRADGTVDLHVSRVSGGPMSTALVERTHPGDALRLSPPAGSLSLGASPSGPLTFIAAGTGWAPMKALLEQLAGARYADEVRLFVVARDAAYLYDRPALEALGSRLPCLHTTFITPAPGRDPLQATERLMTALGHRSHWPHHSVFLAGPPGFMAEVREVLVGLGAAESRISCDAVPPVGPGPRPLGSAEWLLNRPVPRWHNPAARNA
ncbi:FAD-binding oxidoreductase [Streptomyces violascens]|uniref:nitric oxide dioxygenase n=1 Tax=Streptomyces violascens TaxID=67381 RepID=A0ABQ3R2K6_9ACTN|nr:FAD-binding oxidoreductase [Streptomyces violascens]GHI43764.1 flavohemoprotein [Streptomyces violascens]